MNQRKDPYFQPYTLRARRQGKTTEAIKTAPPGAFYIVHAHPMMLYAQKLARHLGRGDLRIVHVMSTDDDLYALAGTNKPALMDHAFNPTVRQLIKIQLHNARVSAKENKS